MGFSCVKVAHYNDTAISDSKSPATFSILGPPPAKMNLLGNESLTEFSDEHILWGPEASARQSEAWPWP